MGDKANLVAGIRRYTKLNNEVNILEEIFKVAGALIVSIGGSGAILFGLSSWLGKVWANRILETEKKKFAMEIEKYKSKLNKEINIANSIIDKAVYVTKLQYDKEFSIYLEIWEKLAKCVISTKALYPTFENVPSDENELKEFKENKWSRFVESYNEYSNAIIKYSPFYEEKIHKGFIELRNLCNKQGNIFSLYEFEVKNSLTYAMVGDKRMSAEEHEEVYVQTPKKINELQELLQKEIRQHLKNLQAIEK